MPTWLCLAILEYPIPGMDKMELHSISSSSISVNSTTTVYSVPIVKHLGIILDSSLPSAPLYIKLMTKAVCATYKIYLLCYISTVNVLVPPTIFLTCTTAIAT